MKLDIYRRPEPEHKHSFMVVPAGEPIPAEADNVDWHLVESGKDLSVDGGSLQEYAIDDPAGQIREKGYAITSVTHQVDD